MKKRIYIIIGGILILVISILLYFFYDKNTDTYIPAENNISNTIEFNNMINISDLNDVSINVIYSEENELITDDIETGNTNNSTVTEQIIEKKENVNTDTNTGTSRKNEQTETVKETTKVETQKQQTKVEIPETPKQEIQQEIETPKQEEPTTETPVKQETTLETEQVQLDFSKYDRYYPALNGGYTCFKKNPEEIAKLKSLIEDAIKEFGYENVIIIEDSSIISERYFTANKTNVQNVVYNSDYFTILYYAETEYGLTKEGNERINQVRSYTKVIGQ